MRSKFDEQLSTLNKELTYMGAMCEEIISLISEALTDNNISCINKVSTLYNDIDRMERSIESLCLKLLLQQQPVARDLRQISAALKMITDMERIGDQAADIAEIIGYLNGRITEDRKTIAQMAKSTITMVSDSIDAFVNQNIEIAKKTIDYDDIIDEYFVKIKNSLIKLIANKPTEGEFALDLLMIAKYFEKIGDHAVNIAEWVVFSVTGVHKGNNI